MVEDRYIVLEIEDFIGSAFYTSIRKNGNRVLKFSKIDEYARKVVDNLNEKGKKARLNFSTEADEEFFYKYSDWFIRTRIDNAIYIALDAKVTSMDLFKKFLTSISLEVLSSLEDEENTKVLFK